jgi:shikimate dehydrogenase
MTAPHPIHGGTRVYGLLGQPVAHSLSPAMHNAAFRALGLDSVYVAFPVAPEQIETAISGLAAAGVAGFNLTVPHKSAILPLLTDITPEARAVGAVNTVRCEDGKLHGTNTDGTGFLLSLEHDLGIHPGGKTVLLLGAGGAGRAIAFSLLASDVERLIIANRTVENAQALAMEFGKSFPHSRIECVGLNSVAGLEPHLLVQATPVGMGDEAIPVELERIGVSEAVVDIIYHPLETPLLKEAGRLGLPYANGIGMLLYQGVAAFRFWTGKEPPVTVMLEALMDSM